MDFLYLSKLEYKGIKEKIITYMWTFFTINIGHIYIAFEKKGQILGYSSVTRVDRDTGKANQDFGQRQWCLNVWKTPKEQRVISGLTDSVDKRSTQLKRCLAHLSISSPHFMIEAEEELHLPSYFLPLSNS